MIFDHALVDAEQITATHGLAVLRGAIPYFKPTETRCVLECRPINSEQPRHCSRFRLASRVPRNLQ